MDQTPRQRAHLGRVDAQWLTWGGCILLVATQFARLLLPSHSTRLLVGAQGLLFSTDCRWRNAQGALYLNDTMRTTYKTCYETGVLPNAVSCTTSSICYECFCKVQRQ
jgi:hypothetical protein